ncbi:hypothetical protein MNV49_002360 [Pseudohyphozyma bogoriensis]|nr:hypothetical protein MNV49_002360 [Pseudohyphozyma bogoriensis]
MGLSFYSSTLLILSLTTAVAFTFQSYPLSFITRTRPSEHDQQEHARDGQESVHSRAASRSTEQSEESEQGKEKERKIWKFKASYLIVYGFVMGADWLQGPYVFSLYHDEFNLSLHTVAFLFTLGFLSAAVSAPFIGPLADTYGRRGFCYLFCFIYILSCLTKTLPSPQNRWLLVWLVAGRVFGGVGTSLLFTVFESWLVGAAKEFEDVGEAEVERVEVFGGREDLQGALDSALAIAVRVPAHVTPTCTTTRGSTSSGTIDLPLLLSHCTLLNGLVAASSGVFSDFIVVRSNTFKGPFWASAVLLVVAAVGIWAGGWKECFGGEGGKVSGEIEDPSLSVLAIVMTAFETSMYLFVFLWVPTLQDVGRADDPETGGDLPLGTIFSSFMVAMMLGSLISTEEGSSNMVVVAHSKILFAVLAVAAGALIFPVVWEWVRDGALVGVRTRLTDPSQITALFRVPLNLLITTFLLCGMEDPSRRDLVASVSAGMLVVAAVGSGWGLGRGAGGGVKLSSLYGETRSSVRPVGLERGAWLTPTAFPVFAGPNEPLIGSTNFVAAWNAAGQQPDQLEGQMQVLYATILALAARTSRNAFLVECASPAPGGRPPEMGLENLRSVGSRRSQACVSLTKAALSSLDRHATLRLPSSDGVVALLILEDLVEVLEDEGQVLSSAGTRPLVNGYVGAVSQLLQQGGEHGIDSAVGWIVLYRDFLWSARTGRHHLLSSADIERIHALSEAVRSYDRFCRGRDALMLIAGSPTMAFGPRFNDRFFFALGHVTALVYFAAVKCKLGNRNEDTFSGFLGGVRLAFELLDGVVEAASTEGLLLGPYIRRHVRTITLTVCRQAFSGYEVVRERFEGQARVADDDYRQKLGALSSPEVEVGSVGFMDMTSQSDIFHNVVSWASVLVDTPAMEQGGPRQFSFDAKIGDLETIISALRAIQYFQARPQYATATAWLVERVEDVRRQRLGAVRLGEMSNESLSNKAGNATNGAIGDQTLLNQASTLASHTLDYAKGVAGLGKAKGAESAQDATNNPQGESGSHTLGDLVNEGRNLAASVLHSAQEVVGTGADKTKEAAGDAQASADSGKPQGYVAQARDLAASALGTVESYVAAGAQKVQDTAATTSTDDIKAGAASSLDKAGQKAEDVKQAALNTTTDDIKAATSDLLNKADQAKKDTQAETKAEIKTPVHAPLHDTGDDLIGPDAYSDGADEWMYGGRSTYRYGGGTRGRMGRVVLASVRTSRALQVTVVGCAMLLVFGYFGDSLIVDEEMWGTTARERKLESLYGMGRFEGRTWLDHVMSLDERLTTSLAPDRLSRAPLTKFTQKFLHEWQNPPLEECVNKTFYIPELHGEHTHGLGAVAHVIGWQMRNAIDVGAIFAWHPSTLGQLFIDPLCLTDGVHNLDCLFEPTTHCPRSSFKNIINGDQLEQLELAGGAHTTAPEKLLSQFREAMPFTVENRPSTYWWRGQAAAYTMRLNCASLAHIRASRFNATSHFTWERDSAGLLMQHEMPWPLPEGTQSMHVRHGDKGIEMKLIDFREYVIAGERLAAMNPYSYYKLAFVSSEDPAVLEEARTVSRLDSALPTPNAHWRWFGSEIQWINSGPAQQLKAFGNRSETTLSWMAELMIALDNWNRLIDELRCIWIDSCKGPFIEVGTEDSWRTLGW